MKRPSARKAILAALAAALLAAVAVVLANLDSLTAGAQPTVLTVPLPRPSGPEVSATVGSVPTARPLPPGFVGLSLEYPAILRYTGAHPDRALVRLIRDLSPGQRPVLRIGGNSTDVTWWPQPGEVAPRHAEYALTERWLSVTKGLAAALDARMILGVNLAGGSPAAAAAEDRAFRRAIGLRYLEGLEIGNEPDVYGLSNWYARPRDYSLSDFIREFARWRATLAGNGPVVGPAYATSDWGLVPFIAANPGLKLATIHHYPLRACYTNPKTRGYPSVPNLLADAASSGMVKQITPYLGSAHARGIAVRLDETNSASCSGKWGVSNTFASALWILDTLFHLASAGVDGVNVHTFPGAAYAPFELYHGRALVRPEYYGMLLFTQAFPAGARLLPVHVSPSGRLKVWATEGGGTRVTAINKDPSQTYQVRLRAPGLAGPAQVELLAAPSAWSTSGVTLGGRAVGEAGRLQGRRRVEIVTPTHGLYSITVPAASAALLTK